MNNRGQSLVTFVLIVPIVFLVIIMTYDVGRMVLLKKELNNINDIAINYGLDNITDENIVQKIEDLIYKNKEELDNVNVYFEEDKLHIMIEDSFKTKMSLSNIFKVKSSYVGYMDNDKKKIERNR